MRTKQNTAGAVRVRARQRVLVRADVTAARIGSVVILASALCWLLLLAVREHLGFERVAPGRFGWSVALLVSATFIARGVFLGRPVTARHALIAAAAAGVGVFAHFLSYGVVGNFLIAASGLALVLPTTAKPQPELLDRVWPLIDATREDPLSPFAMHSSKRYHFNADGSAAIAYRTRLGFAVVSGDPIGDDTQFEALVADFVRMCRSRGWQIIVLAAGERDVSLWRNDVVGQPMLAVPIGRDVVVDVTHFTLTGRRFRNLRQAVQRTRNAGVTTQIVDEQQLDSALRAELTEVLYAAHRAARTERGFCMNLDAALQGRYPGIKLAIARDRSGRVVAFHRYTSADAGLEVSLDAPFRRPDAPNGVDERLSVDMINDAKANGALRLSLAFAAFPEIFDAADPTPLQRAAYRLIHLLDPLIRLESLYRYLCKFHCVAERRYVVLCAHHIPAALLVLLSLEFLPRPRRHRLVR